MEKFDAMFEYVKTAKLPEAVRTDIFEVLELFTEMMEQNVMMSRVIVVMDHVLHANGLLTPDVLESAAKLLARMDECRRDAGSNDS